MVAFALRRGRIERFDFSRGLRVIVFMAFSVMESALRGKFGYTDHHGFSTDILSPHVMQEQEGNPWMVVVVPEQSQGGYLHISMIPRQVP